MDSSKRNWLKRLGLFLGLGATTQIAAQNVKNSGEVEILSYENKHGELFQIKENKEGNIVFSLGGKDNLTLATAERATEKRFSYVDGLVAAKS